MKDKVIQEAKHWVGYLEKKSDAQLSDFKANAGSNNYTIFSYWYDQFWQYPNFRLQGDAWCAGFVSIVFIRALGKTAQTRILPNFHYCPTGVNTFKKRGEWVTENPQPGDVIFFKNSSGVSNHVGIVSAVDAKRVYTVEGNTSSAAGVVANGGCVAEKSYALNYAKILGYGRPKYEEDVDMEKLKELEARIKALEGENIVYDYVPDMPDWAHEPMAKLWNLGALKGDGERLGISHLGMRILCVVVRVLEAAGVL